MIVTQSCKYYEENQAIKKSDDDTDLCADTRQWEKCRLEWHRMAGNKRHFVWNKVFILLSVIKIINATANNEVVKKICVWIDDYCI